MKGRQWCISGHVGIVTLIILTALFTGTSGQCGENSPLTLAAAPYLDQNFSSPGYPEDYPDSATCQWNITYDWGHVIRLYVQDIDMEATANCSLDSIAIYDGGHQLLARLCHNSDRGRYIYSSWPSVYVVFTSNPTLSLRGFRIKYRAVLESDSRPSTARPNTTSSPRTSSPTPAATTPASARTTTPGYIRECGQGSPLSLTAELYREERFASPNYPDRYPESTNCTWRIITDFRYVIQLSVDDMDLETRTEDDGLVDCPYDSVAVRDGEGESSPRIAKMCDHSAAGRVLYSSGSSLYITFVSDVSVTRRGFLMQFKAIPRMDRPSTTPITSTTTIATTSSVEQCSASQQELWAESYEKTLSSPNYPNFYPPDSDCLWKIRTAESGYVVQLTVAHIELEENGGCEYDRLVVMNSDNSTLATMCYNFDEGRRFNSTGRDMYVRFHSNYENEFNGFRLTYRAVPSKCGTPLLRAVPYETNELKSPNYPNSYHSDTRCSWTIQTSNYDYVVRLDVVSMDLETCTECECDRLLVYDTDNVTRLGNMCATENAGRVLFSSGHRMYIRFSTDSSVDRQGFHLNYKAVHSYERFTTTTLPTTTIRQQTHCSGVETYLSATTYLRILTSPNYPDNYPANSECSWRIHTDLVGYVVRLTVTHLDLEVQTDCSYDGLVIKDSDGETVLATMCNGYRVDSSFNSTSSDMYVRFYSDSSDEFSSFRLTYEAVPAHTQTCGGRLTAWEDDTQYLSSPNYPNNYPSNSRCYWTITANEYDYGSDYLVRVDVEDITMECSYDSLDIVDSDNETVLASLCSSGSVYFSSSSVMYVRFTSDGSTEYQGFRLSYKSVPASERYTTPSTITSAPERCSEGLSYLTAETYQQTLTSPNYPGNYPADSDCSWKIRTLESGYVVQLHVTDLDLETHSGCTYDRLVVTDSDDATTLATMCYQYNEGRQFNSSGRDMYVQFHSDGSNEDTGFSLTYQAVLPVTQTCNGGQHDLTAWVDEPQILSSPNYPNNYPSDSECTWRISTDYDYVVRIYVDDITLECGYDSLVILDSDNDDQLGSLCEMSSSHTFYSTGSAMYLQFHSDGSNEYRGFRLRYDAVPEGGPYDPYPFTPSPQIDNLKREVNISLIAGGVTAGVIVLSFIVLATVCGVRKARKRSPREPYLLRSECPPAMEPPPVYSIAVQDPAPGQPRPQGGANGTQRPATAGGRNGNQPPAYSTDDPLRVPSASGTQQGQGPTVAHTASTPQSQTSTPQSQTTTQQGQANSVASLLQAHCPPTVSEASRASDVPTISCVAAPGMAGATASPGSIDLGVPTETIA